MILEKPPLSSTSDATSLGLPLAEDCTIATLIVDDEVMVVQEMIAFLQRRGLTVLAAHSAAEALDRIVRRPDIGVVVSDIRMPGASGLELAEQLRRDRDAAADPAIVMMTAHGTMDDAVTALRFGAMEFLRKPFRMAELERAVRQAITRVQASRQEAEARRLDHADPAGDLHGGPGGGPGGGPRGSPRGSPFGYLGHQWEIDAETGLLTRAGMHDALATRLRPRSTQPACLLTIQIKLPVDSQAGQAPSPDAELEDQIRRRLLRLTALGDLVGGFGDNEFAILRLNAEEESCQRWVERLQEELRAPYFLGTRVIGRAYVKIGIAHSSHVSEGSLWRAAQLALSVALLRPGSNTEWHTVDLQAPARMRFILRDRHASETLSDALEFRFQPIISVGDGRLSGFEMLLRCRDDSLGSISTAAFLKIAEECGIMRAVDEIALRQAVQHAGRWCRQYGFSEYINVNVSPLSLRQPGFADIVRKTLESANLPARHLRVEIVENGFLDQAVLEELANIRKLGVKIAIDDFGIGLSNLSRLLDLPADVVKFDRTFLRTQGDMREQADFLDLSVRLVHSCALIAVMEGVETGNDWDLVRSVGFDQAQGFWLGVPLQAVDAEQLLGRS